MKKGIIIGSVVLVVGVGTFFLSMPRISVKRVDKLGRSVDYKMTAGFGSMEGTQRLSDTTTSQKSFAGYDFSASSEGGRIVLTIRKRGKIKRVEYINF